MNASYSRVLPILLCICALISEGRSLRCYTCDSVHCTESNSAFKECVSFTSTSYASTTLPTTNSSIKTQSTFSTHPTTTPSTTSTSDPTTVKHNQTVTEHYEVHKLNDKPKRSIADVKSVSSFKCMSSKFKDNGVTKLMMGCVEVKNADQKDMDVCKNAVEGGIEIQSCKVCSTDLCNSASGKSIHTIVILALFVGISKLICM